MLHLWHTSIAVETVNFLISLQDQIQTSVWNLVIIVPTKVTCIRWHEDPLLPLNF